MRTYSLVFLLASFTLFAFSCKRDKDNTAQGEPVGHIDPSIAQLSELIEKTPNDATLYYQRAEIYYGLEGFDEAIQDLEKAISIDSLNADYLHLLADVYLDYYQSFKALKTMEKAASLHPGRIPTLLKLSEFQLILKQGEQALATLERIRKIDPQNAEMLYMAGLVFEDQGEIDKAIASFQSAVDMEPELIEGWISLGKLWGQKEKGRALALQFFDNALRVDSNSINALHEKAYFLSNTLNDLNGALAIYQKMIAIDSQYPEAYYNAGLIYLDMDSIKRAVEQFNLNIQIDPTYYPAFYYRGVCSEMLGDKEAARRDYEQAVALAPDFERAQEALNKLRQ
jgi:tetratricopeptide (TPR) repeat protein